MTFKQLVFKTLFSTLLKIKAYQIVPERIKRCKVESSVLKYKLRESQNTDECAEV